MNSVYDHGFVWLAFDRAQLSSRASAAVDQARRSQDGLAISDISLLELAALARRGRIRLDTSLESFRREVESRFVVLPITAHVAAIAMELPPAYPSDPADRLIGATALAQRLSLITADREIRKAKAVPTIW